MFPVTWTVMVSGRTSERGRHGGAGSHTHTGDDVRELPIDPPVLEPYSPTVRKRGRRRKESDPMALDPYSPL